MLHHLVHCISPQCILCHTLMITDGHKNAYCIMGALFSNGYPHRIISFPSPLLPSWSWVHSFAGFDLECQVFSLQSSSQTVFHGHSYSAILPLGLSSAVFSRFYNPLTSTVV